MSAPEAPPEVRDAYDTPEQRIALMQRDREDWLDRQPKEVQDLARELDGSPKEIMKYAQQQLIGNVFTIGFLKDRVVSALTWALEEAVRKGDVNATVRAAKVLLEIEGRSVSLLNAVDGTSFKAFGENVQINIGDMGAKASDHRPGEGVTDVEWEERAAEARRVLDRFCEVVGADGALLVDRRELQDPGQEA